MNETAAFVRYEKRTAVMSVLSIVFAAVFLASVCIFAVLGLVLGGGEQFPIYYWFMLGSAVIYAGVALPLNFIANRRKVNVTLYRAYAKVLVRNPHNSVAEISEVCNRTESAIIADFVKLKELGFFDEIEIDDENKRVSVGSPACEERNETVCPKCGGKMVSRDDSAYVCEFCGVVSEKGRSDDSAPCEGETSEYGDACKQCEPEQIKEEEEQK